MRYVTITLICLLCGPLCNAQHRYMPLKVSSTFSLSDAVFVEYRDASLRPDMRSQQDALYDTPENVLRSELSANTIEWMKEIYYVPPADLSSDNIAEKNRNRDSLSCQLLHKLQFSYNGVPTAMIRTNLLYGSTPVFGMCIVYQEKSGRWYRAPQSDLQKLMQVVWHTKTQSLKQLLEAKNTGNIAIDDVIRKTQTPFGFDSLRFLDLMLEWEQNQNEDLLNYFLER